MRRLFFLSLLTLNIQAEPCTASKSECTEWVTVASHPHRLLVYGSHRLEARNESIRRALVLVHGGSRDADGQFRTALAAAFLAGALADTIILAPRFASNTGQLPNKGGAPCRDSLDSSEANWICNGSLAESWRYGGGAIGNPNLTSYDFADEIVRKLARKAIFPNLKHIVIAGHSGGGMFTQRYQMANQVHETLGVRLSYVVANPTTVSYIDTNRPTAAAYPVSAGTPGFFVPAPREAFAEFPDRNNCTTFDDWPMGLKKRTGYSARVPDSQLKKQLAERPSTYLLGALEVFPIAGFDDSCPAMAQGPTRLARGLAFTKYANEAHGAHLNPIVIPNCGHNARCLLTDDAALPLLFPKD